MSIGALSPQMMVVSVEQFNLLFVQVQNLVVVIQAIQANLALPSITQPSPVMLPMVSQPVVQPTLALPPTTLYPCPKYLHARAVMSPS